MMGERAFVRAARRGWGSLARQSAVNSDSTAPLADHVDALRFEAAYVKSTVGSHSLNSDGTLPIALRPSMRAQFEVLKDRDRHMVTCPDCGRRVQVTMPQLFRLHAGASEQTL